MALLDDTARGRVAAQIMREAITTWGAHTKGDLRAAINSTDQWIEDNTASFNTALPQPFRGAATTEQKSLVFAFVLWRRIGRLRAEED